MTESLKQNDSYVGLETSIEIVCSNIFERSHHTGRALKSNVPIILVPCSCHDKLHELGGWLLWPKQTTSVNDNDNIAYDNKETEEEEEEEEEHGDFDLVDDSDDSFSDDHVATTQYLCSRTINN